MYRMDEKVRYSETDANGRMNLDALLNYFQDCSVSQSEALGIGVSYLAEHHIAWLLNSWQIKISRMPKLEEKITVGTWACGFKGFYGYRSFVLEDAEGVRIAEADSTWVLIDTEAGRPMRVPPELPEIYVLEPPIEMETRDPKLAMPETYSQEEPVRVPRFYIDTNHHMNNEKYVMLAQEYLTADFTIRELRVDYKKAAMLDDVIYPRVSMEDGKCTVALADGDGKPFAIVAFYA